MNYCIRPWWCFVSILVTFFDYSRRNSEAWSKINGFSSLIFLSYACCIWWAFLPTCSINCSFVISWWLEVLLLHPNARRLLPKELPSPADYRAIPILLATDEFRSIPSLRVPVNDRANLSLLDPVNDRAHPSLLASIVPTALPLLAPPRS